MPGLDERITRAMRESARTPAVDSGAVTRAVETKRARRRVRRNVGTGAAVTAVLVVTAVVTVGLLQRDGGDEVRISTPPPTTGAVPEDPAEARAEIAAAVPEAEPADVQFVSSAEAIVTTPAARGVRMEEVNGTWQIDPASQCRLDPAVKCGPPEVRVGAGDLPLGPDAYAGAPAAVEPLTNPTTEYARAPVFTSGNASWVAVYDGETFDFPPSHVLDLASGRRIDLQGEILSLAEDDNGTLWAVTQDKIVDPDGTEYRLKRIPKGGTPISTPLPAELVPAGGIVAGTDRVYIPMRDSVLEYQPGSPSTRIAFPESARRQLAVLTNGNVVATHGTSLWEVNRSEGVARGPVLDTGPGSPLTDLVATTSHVWAIAGGELLRLDSSAQAIEARIPLPAGFLPSSLAADGDRVLVTGTADLAGAGDPASPSVAVEPIALVVGPSGIEQTIVIGGGADTAVALEPSGDLLLTSGGVLYRADLP